ncbi:MAG TPA: CocE/NonD family hydrolase [Nocardioides sp.]|nr:CocE/NonD family hydrolase [Nocardioides sp.]
MTTTAPERTQDPTATPSRGIRQTLREHRVFFVATAAVMLHIADDSFFQPEPGVSPADHLVSGLAPLGLLAAGAAAFPRVRAGARAVLAILFGLVGILVGLGEAGYYTVTVGPSGDDYTGFLAAAGGVALFVLAALTLWRSRKPGRSRPRRYLRRGLLGALGVIVVAEVFTPFAISYVTTHVHTAEVPEAKLGVAYEDVTFTTSDDLEIAAWYVPSRNGAAVIIPGRTKSQAHARMLIEHGYGVLLYDRRGEGASEGDPHLYGWGGSRDVHGAIEFLQARPDVDPDRIGGLGLSVSGEMLLQAAAESSDLAAVVSEGAGTRSMSEELEEFDAGMTVRGFHVMVTKQAGLMTFSNQMPPESLVDLMPRVAPRPVLLIWAPNGGNRETLNPVYQEQIGPSADIWEIDDVQHVKGLQGHPEEYERRVIGFLDDALLDHDSASGE